eukprot:3872199-Rhodomonas_salina.2
MRPSREAHCDRQSFFKHPGPLKPVINPGRTVTAGVTVTVTITVTAPAVSRPRQSPAQWQRHCGKGDTVTMSVSRVTPRHSAA